jgi:hypothetical protein
MGEGRVKEKSPREIKSGAAKREALQQKISHRNISISHRNIIVVDTTTAVLKCNLKRRCNTFESQKA